MEEEKKEIASPLTKQQLKNKRKKEASKKKKMMETQKRNEEKVEEREERTDKDNEIIDNFEEELCWCIKQLDIGLQTQKPNIEQCEKSRKLIIQLRSTKTPKPKKRIIMKKYFGNYRDKMKKEMLRETVTPAVIFPAKDEAMKNSVFIKKKMNNLPSETLSSQRNDFRFNFADPTQEHGFSDNKRNDKYGK